MVVLHKRLDALGDHTAGRDLLVSCDIIKDIGCWRNAAYSLM